MLCTWWHVHSMQRMLGMFVGDSRDEKTTLVKRMKAEVERSFSYLFQSESSKMSLVHVEARPSEQGRQGRPGPLHFSPPIIHICLVLHTWRVNCNGLSLCCTKCINNYMNVAWCVVTRAGFRESMDSPWICETALPKRASLNQRNINTNVVANRKCNQIKHVANH